MNIKVVMDSSLMTDLTGGEYGILNLEIHVDPDLPVGSQRLLVIHSVIENYCPSWVHDKIDDLCELIEDGLDCLERERNELDTK